MGNGTGGGRSSRMATVAAIRDPVARAKAAHDALRLLDDERLVALGVRQVAVRELRERGWTWTQIADLLGIHRNRAAHLLDHHVTPTSGAFAEDGRPAAGPGSD